MSRMLLRKFGTVSYPGYAWLDDFGTADYTPYSLTGQTAVISSSAMRRTDTVNSVDANIYLITPQKTDEVLLRFKLLSALSGTGAAFSAILFKSNSSATEFCYLNFTNSGIYLGFYNGAFNDWVFCNTTAANTNSGAGVTFEVSYYGGKFYFIQESTSGVRTTFASFTLNSGRATGTNPVTPSAGWLPWSDSNHRFSAF